MAVQSTFVKSALSIKYKEGVDPLGNDIIKTKKFSNVKTAAVNQNIYDVAAAFEPLMKYPLSEVVRNDDSLLINL